MTNQEMENVVVNTRMGLAFAFGSEWASLNSEERSLLADDFTTADISAAEYRRRIGRGNLRSYVNCLLVVS